MVTRGNTTVGLEDGALNCAGSHKRLEGSALCPGNTLLRTPVDSHLSEVTFAEIHILSLAVCATSIQWLEVIHVQHQHIRNNNGNNWLNNWLNNNRNDSKRLRGFAQEAITQRPGIGDGMVTRGNTT